MVRFTHRDYREFTGFLGALQQLQIISGLDGNYLWRHIRVMNSDNYVWISKTCE